MRISLLLLSIIGLNDAKVSFSYSTLFDEFDLNGNKEAIALDNCINGGCGLFVSASDRAMEATRNIFIQDNDLTSNSTLYESANGYDRNTGKLKVLQLAKTGYFMRNYNTGNIGPIVIYVVASGAPLYQSNYLELFDGLRMNRADNAASYVTILGAEPFDLYAQAYGNLLQAYIRATGFDSNSQRQPNPDNCQIIYDQSGTDPFRLHINSPIITIAFDGLFKTQICARKNNNNVALLDYAGIATSPGYIGCAGAAADLDRFRSTGYPSTSFDLHDSANVDRMLDIDYTITTKSGDKVNFAMYSNGGATNTFFDQGTNKEVHRTDRAYKMTVDLADPTLGSYYLVRYDPQTPGSIPTGEGVCPNNVPQTTASGVSSTTPVSTTTTSGSNDLSTLPSLIASLFVALVVC